MSSPITWLQLYINMMFKDKQAWQIVRDTLLAAVASRILYKFLKRVQDIGLKKAIIGSALQLAQTVASGAVKANTQKEVQKIHDQFLNQIDQTEEKHVTLPAKGINQEHLHKVLTKWCAHEKKLWSSGKITGAVYHGGDKLKSFVNKVYGLFSIANPLHPETFPYVRKMEAEVVRMTCNLFNGGKEGVGVMTSGGTESILTAMHAYREWGRKKKGITRPEIVAPVTAHAAFSKGAHYFGFKLTYVPVNQDTYEVDLEAMRKAITPNTVMLVGSAINYPYGGVDDLHAIGKMALKYNLGVHVDSCLGSFLQALLPKLGYDVPDTDFRVPGVTSISCDTHKFGFSPKGSSVLMWKNAEWRSHHYFVETRWPGGIYATPTMAGSRAGGLIAATWATMVCLGEDGYLECGRAIMKTAEEIKTFIKEKCPELRICGTPRHSTFAVIAEEKHNVGKKLNILMVGEAMTKSGWHMGSLQRPPALHFTCTFMQKNRSESFCKALRKAIDDVIADPSKYNTGNVQLYGVAEALDASGLIDDVVKGYCDMLTQVKPEESKSA